MLLQSIGETYNPTANDILLMVSAGILFFAVLIWRRYTPDKLRSKLVFNKVKKAWLLMSSEEEQGGLYAFDGGGSKIRWQGDGRGVGRFV